ncbi:phenylalanyl-tRNA synthetase beta chain [Paenibacillus shirakamiensis]|uniref:Phenylalanine--tRNA ligase beta subunit n=1 Tax=Paenibacillus shirakamiensis TaxID=1265935 RepID=A0ABS4JH94_9BACL|nr:phenylalanine--tRNA ligase subunit beta [Paenibacillus shirakamiensis]MBP2000476.1 phenylalanyl-tRNA synthetase beta chain [Paenibacillus shirakamiensis]
MKVSAEWLSDYISLENVDMEELAEQITRSGIEIDSVERRSEGVSKVVVGYVKSKEKHPDADKLNVCIIDAGLGEDLQIVCGAKNIDAGQKVPVALVGAKLPGGMEIKNAKLRGVPSQGMICSAKELGLNDKLLPKEQQEGILVLPEHISVGQPINLVLGLDDQVLDFDLTPNRSDCLSMIGAAYEVGAILGRSVKLPEPDKKLIEIADEAKDHLRISIEAHDLCSHYAARYFTHVKIAPSPQWMQNRLAAAGVRPINNIVDITNYVMMEYGQPLHAFDADHIAENSIIVRQAEDGETMTTLDGQERKLEAGALLISDGQRTPIALAGVMGGLNSEVTDQTVNIVLESARFDGGSVRKTSRQLGLRSEASLRFEKEVDPSNVIPALDRAASLIAVYAGGTVYHGTVEEVISKPEEKRIKLSLDKLNVYLGTDISMLEVKTIFGRLNFELADGPGEVEVIVPTRRGDITRDVDLIEEIARLHGYSNIPTTSIEGKSTSGGYTRNQALRRSLRGLLTHGGWNEVISYSFTHESSTALFPTLTGVNKAVKLSLPMSEDRSVLRTSLIPELMHIAAYNRNRKQDNLALFEIGNIFLTEEDKLTRQPKEQSVLGFFLAGLRQEKQWNVPAEKVDFYDLKGAVESVITYLGLTDLVSYVADRPEGFHPGRSASLFLNVHDHKVRVGVLGQLHPDLARNKDLDDTYVAEILLEPLYQHANRVIVSRELPKFPSVERDIALVVDTTVEAGSLLSSIRESAGEWLTHVQVFDVFTGSKLGENKKSIAISLTYQHKDRTLTEEDITQVHDKVVNELVQSFDAELRK